MTFMNVKIKPIKQRKNKLNRKGYNMLKPYTSAPMQTVVPGIMDKKSSNHHNGRKLS
jgi:hypothetical protein